MKIPISKTAKPICEKLKIALDFVVEFKNIIKQRLILIGRPL